MLTHKRSAFQWTKCLQIPAKRTKFALWQHQILPKLNGLMWPLLDKGLETKLIENTTCLCKDGQLVIPKPLQVCAVTWYHHCFHHPGHAPLKEMMNTAMYWKGMHTTIQSITKSCTTYQSNKRQKLKYRPLPPKTIISTPWEYLYLCQSHWSIHS